jgi:hypothetical protein
MGFKFLLCQRRKLEEFFQGTPQVHPCKLDFFIHEKDVPGKTPLIRLTSNFGKKAIKQGIFGKE